MIYLLCFVLSGVLLLICGFGNLINLRTQNQDVLISWTVIGVTFIFSAIAFSFVMMYLKINDLKYQIKHLKEKIEDIEEKNK